MGDRRNLEGLRGHLTVTDAADPEVQDHLDDLALLPRALYERLAAAGVQVYVGCGNLTELDDNGDLIGVRPPGSPFGSRYEHFGGLYRFDRREVTIGTVPPSQTNRALHEVGHAVGDVLGYNGSSELAAAFNASFAGLPDAVKQYGRTARGRRETLAETFAATVESEAGARVLFGDPLVEFALGMLRDLS
ncbi:MAG: hypothetical protein HYU66_04780 [Armatimonadetes bacterium]|nr:hypothetical protein [Armatimonadota bacterium]